MKKKKFLQIGYNDFDYISVIFETISLNKVHMRYLRESNGMRTRGPKQNIYSAEIGFTGRTDFIVIKYSITNNGLYSNNPIRFQDNIVKDHIGQCTLCAVSVHWFLIIYEHC
jgi:hypothetical protein